MQTLYEMLGTAKAKTDHDLCPHSYLVVFGGWRRRETVNKTAFKNLWYVGRLDKGGEQSRVKRRGAWCGGERGGRPCWDRGKARCRSPGAVAEEAGGVSVGTRGV